MADTEELGLVLQTELISRLSSAAEVFLSTSDQFATSNLRFTEYERPVSEFILEFEVSKTKCDEVLSYCSSAGHW